MDTEVQSVTKSSPNGRVVTAACCIRALVGVLGLLAWIDAHRIGLVPWKVQSSFLGEENWQCTCNLEWWWSHQTEVYLPVPSSSL